MNLEKLDKYTQKMKQIILNNKEWLIKLDKGLTTSLTGVLAILPSCLNNELYLCIVNPNAFF